MGFLDKLKETASSAAEAAKGAVEQARTNAAVKQAERVALDAEMREKAAAKAQEIMDTIAAYDNAGSVFDGIETAQLLSFTKEFYDKLLLPAMSVNLSKIAMYPYIDGKELDKIKKSLSDYDDAETPILAIKAENKQYILITEQTLYFSICLEESKKHFAQGKVDISEIDSFSFICDEEKASFACDGYVLASFEPNKTIREDFLSLTKYFDCIAKKDFAITDEEVDALVREKIGDKIVNEIKKYMIFDDEKFVYFAWGLDSLAAKDYIVCTNKQIIVMDREAFGMTANIKQFYYEDITSASTEQNSNNNDLTGFLLESAITATTQTCDLYFSVAGARTKIKTLYKREAERIVALFHQYRKEAKMASAQPQVIVQQAAPVEDPLETLKKLKSLLDAGILSEEEFNVKKAEILSKI